MKERIKYLDRIKAFAILLMVLAHVYLFSLQMGDNIVFTAISSFHMPLFMFISGFVAFIPTSKLNGGGIFKKWRKRFFAYLCPAIMVGWLLTLFRYVVIRDIDLSVLSFIDGAWYLKCMAIFCCIQFLIIRLKHLWQELLVCLMFYVLFFYGWKHSGFLNQLLVLEHCTCFFPFFVLGYYARKYNIVDYINKNLVYTLAVVGYFCLFFCTIENHLLMNICDRFVRPTFAIIAIVYLFMRRETKESRVEKWLSDIGTQTLDIYIYHGFFIHGALQLNLLFLKDWTIATNNHILCLIIATAISIMLAYISIFIGKIIRTSDFFRKLIYGQFWK